MPRHQSSSSSSSDPESSSSEEINFTTIVVSNLTSTINEDHLKEIFSNFGQIQSLNTRIGIWSHNLHIEKQDYNLNDTCKICGELQTIN